MGRSLMWSRNSGRTVKLSRRERWRCLSKPNDLVREAVGCNGVLARNLDDALALNSG